MAKKNTRQVVTTVGAVIVLVIAVTMAVRNTGIGQPAQAQTRYHYDLATADIVEGPADQIDGVIAHVYTCSTCDASKQAVYIESLTPEAVAAIANKDADPTAAGRAMTEGVIYAEPPAAGEDPTWLPHTAPQAVELTAKPLTLCDGQPAKRCTP